MTPAGGDVPNEEGANLEEMEVVELDDKGADGPKEKETNVQTVEPTNDPQVLVFIFLSFSFL